MSQQQTISHVEKWLIRPLEVFYGQQHYPRPQAAEIIKRFNTLTDEKLIALYDFVIGVAERKPVLSKLIELWERSNRSQTVPGIAATGAMNGRNPWEVRSATARDEAKAYLAGVKGDGSVWQQAVEEQWSTDAGSFIEAWAQVQSEMIQGATGFGISRDMLAFPVGDAQYDARLREMRDAIRAAVQARQISVPVPEWLIEYARARAAHRPQPQKYYSAQSAIRETARQITN